ncbi:hypothetical protein DM819_06135 [Pseudomonas hunanensis]|uniref:YceK/YidQ family lipoprotein n=1 Tax=Pseudomonas hunanensis TaxID=1247546 RepID=A0ABD6N9X8_9PSED|nr:hypothetical protein [Pseudomonas hunanensis]ALG88772.1 Hypothetical protein Drgb7_00031 [uncultured bacterium]NWL45462.1 hypothetical protein [Pseudomonas hunanensis]
MNKSILILCVLASLTGCNTTNVSGTGEFFTLTGRNVVYRDLTRPVAVDNEPEQTNYVVFPSATK